MRTLERHGSQDRQVACVACASHMHPEMVPWLQHEIGCPVRTAAIVSYSEHTGPGTGHLRAATASPRL